MSAVDPSLFRTPHRERETLFTVRKIDLQRYMQDPYDSRYTLALHFRCSPLPTYEIFRTPFFAHPSRVSFFASIPMFPSFSFARGWTIDQTNLIQWHTRLEKMHASLYSFTRFSLSSITRKWDEMEKSRSTTKRLEWVKSWRVNLSMKAIRTHCVSKSRLFTIHSLQCIKVRKINKKK